MKDRTRNNYRVGRIKNEKMTFILSPSTFILAACVLVFADQTRFLYCYPVPDTGMWFGDETWTMLTVRALARTGVAHLPEALGSSLAHSNGLINGSIWLSGIIYGVPANLFGSVASPVAIGRTITVVLSLLILFTVYRISREIGTSPLSSLAGVFVLLISNAFYFSSHSARLDAITGLAVLLYYWFLVRIFRKYASAAPRYMNIMYFTITFLAVLSLAIYVHVPTLIALPALYSLWKFGAFKDWRGILFALTGAVSAACIVLLIYKITVGTIDLLGSGYNQYYNVANSLPILHLFSWRVQKINTIDRFIQIWQVAWPLVCTLVVGIVAKFIISSSKGKEEIPQFFIILTALGLLSWMLAEGPAVFYNIHILPVLGVCTAVLLTPLFSIFSERVTGLVVIFVVVVLAIRTIASQERQGKIGVRLTQDNHAAIHALIDPVTSLSPHPLVLTDQPALNEIAADTNVRLMTNHFLLFGEGSTTLPQILKEKGVNYLLLYSTVRWQSPFRSIADSLYTLIDLRTGILTDQARAYNNPSWDDIDTLRLYKTQ